MVYVCKEAHLSRDREVRRQSAHPLCFEPLKLAYNKPGRSLFLPQQRQLFFFSKTFDKLRSWTELPDYVFNWLVNYFYTSMGIHSVPHQ